MDNYLIDRAALEDLADELIQKKAPSVSTTEELKTLRENTITALDDKIGLAIFGSLTEAQDAELNQLLDRENTTESEFQSFFSRTGLDLETIIADAIQSFSAEFIGGQNA